MCKINDGKKYFFEMLNDVDRKISALSPVSNIRKALSNERLKKIREWIENKNSDDLAVGNWPPLFLYIFSHSVEEISALENDIALVVMNSKETSISALTRYLSADANEVRLWCGGIFEIFIKSQIIKNRLQSELDYILPNGKENDLRISIGDTFYHLECTVLTDSEEDIKVWGRFMTDKKNDRSAILVRPGKYDEPNGKAPSLYYDCLRFYAKVYDKIAPKLNTEEGQLSESNKNVLIISICVSHNILAHSPGVGWVLDELFANQPRVSFSPQGITDVSLSAWVEFTANELIYKKELDFNKYNEIFHKIISAPRKIGGILLFNRCLLKEARINYNAHKGCRISHNEMAQLEECFNLIPSWYRDSL